MEMFRGEYCSFLNSADLYDPELPLVKSSVSGGTMILWKRSFDPHITVVSVDSTSFLPIIFSPPDHSTTIHIAIYLPTQGRDKDFTEDFSKLILCMEQLKEKHPDAWFYLRGDFNVNSSNKTRNCLLDYFCNEKELASTPILHTTYHHFTGEGRSDSHLDKILFSI